MSDQHKEPKGRPARAILVAALTVVTVMVGASSCRTSYAVERATDGVISREAVESAGDTVGVTDEMAGSEIDRAAADAIKEAGAE